MCFRTRTVEVADNGSHTSLVTKSGSKVDWLGLIILGETLDLSAVTAGSLSWEISKRSVTGSFEFTVRHVGGGRLLWVLRFKSSKDFSAKSSQIGECGISRLEILASSKQISGKIKKSS